MTRPVPHPPPPPAGPDAAVQRIREHGGRVTGAKQALVELIYSRHPLTADDIVTALDGHDRSAVYRNLAQLEELGIAEHLHLGHGQAVYRPAGLSTVPVACSSCGATFDLDRTHTTAFAGRVAEQTGVALDLTHFPLTGTCRACSDDGRGAG